MKLMHLGDLHLGKSLGNFDLIDDQKYILDQILDIARDRSVDGVMIAGDVYDRSLPSEASVALLDYFLSELAEAGIKVYMISGNHDSGSRLDYGRRLFSSRDIYISSEFRGQLARETARDEFGNVNIYMLPFIKASAVRHYHPDEAIDTYEDAVRLVIENAQVDENERNVIIAHQYVTGDKDPVLAGSEGPSAVNVGTVERIRADVFADFDYVALGHIHTPQFVGARNIRYSGSPIKYSLSEALADKSVPIITLREKGDTDIEFAELRPRRDLRHLTGELSQILSPQNISDTDDFIYVTLTDEEIINNPMGIIQQYYPNTVKVDIRNSRTADIEDPDLRELAGEKTFEEIAHEFYLKMYGREMGDDERRVLLEAAREAGVIDETD